MFSLLSNPQNAASMFLWSNGKHLPGYMVSHPKRQLSLYWKTLEGSSIHLNEYQHTNWQKNIRLLLTHFSGVYNGNFMEDKWMFTVQVNV